MQSHFSLQKILNILNGKGHSFTNQKGFVEYCKDGKNLLQICTDLLKQIEPSYIRTILATSTHKIGDHLDNHRFSLPINQNLILIRQIFYGTRLDFRLMDYIRPSNERIIAVLSSIYSLISWQKKVYNANENSLARLKILKTDFVKVKEHFSHVQKDLTDIQALKARQKPRCIELLNQQQKLKAQIDQLKKLKNDRHLSKIQKQKIKIDCKRQSQDLSFQSQAKMLQIIQAKTKLSQNAPEIKKQKLRQEAQNFQANNQSQQHNNHLNDITNTIKNEYEYEDKQLIPLLLKSTTFKDHQSNINELNIEIDDNKRYFRTQKQNFDQLVDAIVKDQQIFDNQQQIQNTLNGNIAQLLNVQQDYHKKQNRLKNNFTNQQKNIQFFENNRNMSVQDLQRVTRKTEQIIQKAEMRLCQIEYQTSKYAQELFSTMKRVNQYFNPQQN